MEQDRGISLEDKKKKIEQQMLAIYDKYQQEKDNPITSISYYNQLILRNEESHVMYALQDVYPVEIDGLRKMKKNKIVLYQDGKEIATIDENSNISFSQEYLMQMQKISPQVYILFKQLDKNNFELPELQKENPELPSLDGEKRVEDFTLTKEELEDKKPKLAGQELEEKQEPEREQEKTPENEEENMEKIAQQSGMTKDDIRSCSTINPQEKITDSESFENIANVTGQYTKIFVVASNGQTKDNSRFAFWGLTSDGQVEQIPGLEERQGVNTGKTIYAINRDGSEVKEQQTAALFTLPNQKEGFSVTIGQYGIVETTYIRRSPKENKFIGSTINSTTQKPTTREVKEFMNDSRTTDREIGKTIDKTKHQLDETEKTDIRNIDNNPNNDVALDIDAEIELHDGTVTTLRKESEKLKISPEEYTKSYEEAKGECPSDKIENIRSQTEKDEQQNREDVKDRGERQTPEEEALKRRGLL